MTPVTDEDATGTSRARRSISLFVVGALSAFHVDLGGQVYLGEIAIAVALPLLLLSKKRTPSAVPAAFIWLGLLCLIGYQISAWANLQDFSDAARAMVAMGVLLLTVTGLALWCRTPDEFRLLIVGAAIGGTAATFVQPVFYFADAPWKFGLGLPLTMLAVAMLTRIRQPGARFLLLVAIAAFNLLFDYRSLALIVAIVAIIDVLTLRRRGTASAARLWAVGLSAAAATGIAIATLYEWAAGTGILGESARVKLTLQGGGSALSMLFGGRYEAFFSLPAALERPILGWGPNPIPSPSILQSSYDSLQSLGLSLVADSVGLRETIPTHSIIMSAWLGAGILGLVFWLYTAVLLARGFGKAAALGGEAILPVFLMVLTGWNLLFSPFGGTTRFLTAVAIAYSIHLITNAKRSQETVPDVSASQRQGSS